MWGYSGSNAEAKPEAFFRNEARESRDASAANGKAEQISDPGGALLLEAIDYLLYDFLPDTSATVLHDPRQSPV